MLVNRIRDAMKEESITQLELEKLTGIDQGTLLKIINNKKTGLHLLTAKRIARALNRTVDYLWPDS
jgi:transcriptional regulator with XRE-family HTH domain